MEFASAEFLVLAALTIQVISLSWVLSFIWRNQRQRLLEQFPESQYPNLYVTSQQVEFGRLHVRKWLDMTLLLTGLTLVFVLGYFSFQAAQLTSWLLIFSFIQILPASLSSYWCRANDEVMSTRMPSAIRRTSLTPRQISHYVSPANVVLSVSAFVVMLIFTCWAVFSAQLGDNYLKGLLFLVLGGACISYLIGKVYQLLYGKKSDHFIKPEDRDRILAKRIPQLCQVLTIYSLSLIAMLCFAVFGLTSDYLFVFTSIVLQWVMFLSLKQPLDIDREVYR